MLEEFPVVVEMPFHVSVNGDSETTSTMIVTCRWDLITSEKYIKTRQSRFEDLKKGMLIEAAILIDKVQTQATTTQRWNWFR